ncbi:hypothetical protein OSB04_012582 [Centaurea solstitialis]|uniref:F-box domain-containing protein n=1 Tax=Centaurea solstitialis TaxID=347529 RepID=A0AA38TBN6_9ASTR|nr:hypothetical protein OSB04_012582 [Centaurea solstitialis]
MHDPRLPHLNALKRILRYLKGTLSHGLHIKPSAVDHLVAYSDADWAGVLILVGPPQGDNLVSWSSKRQHVVSRSNAEAEYRGIANVVAEAAWLRNLLLELSCPLSRATVVFCDNVSAMYLASNPVQHQRTKHVEIDLHFVRERVAIGHVRVFHVPFAYQYADIFTKGLPSSLFLDFRDSLNIRVPPDQTTGLILTCSKQIASNGSPFLNMISMNFTMSDYVCDELIVEILQKLPPKSVIRFTSVSKSWFSRIVCHDFVHKHALQAAKKPQKVFIRHLTYFNKRVQSFYTLHSEDQLPLSSKHGYIGITPLEFPGYNFHIVGSCNGILCLFDHKIHQITLWNPSIRRTLTLPDHHSSLRNCSSNGCQAAIGFGFDQVTDDYKIVKITYATYRRDLVPESSIYTINTGVWRAIAFPDTPLNNVSHACFVNGGLYWLVTERSNIGHCYVMSFDLSTEVFDTIPLLEPSWEYTQLTVIKGCLAVITNEGRNSWIWLRKAYKNVTCWSRDLKLNIDPYEGKISKVLQLTTNDDLVLITQCEGYILYNPVKGERLKLASVKGLSIILDVVSIIRSFGSKNVS